METESQNRPARFDVPPRQAQTMQVIRAQMPEALNAGTLRAVHSTVAGEYQPWGPNNRYPQDMLEAINGSGTGAACVDTKAKYIKGDGFADTDFYQAKVNRQGLQVDSLLALDANDLAALYGFCWVVNINGNGHPCEIFHAPFSQWRPAQPDGDGVVRADYLIRKPHKLSKTNGLKATDAKRYPRYNSDETPAERAARIATYCTAEEITLAEYPGELFVYYHKRSGALNHPRPLHDAVVRDMLTEASLKISRHTDVRNGFAAQTMITEYGTAQPSQEKLNADRAKYGEMIGEEGVRLIVQYAQSSDTKPDVSSFQVNNASDRYKSDESSLKDNIRAMFLLPTILYGEATAGKLGASQEMEDAVNYAQRLVVNEDVRALELAYKTVFSIFQPIMATPGQATAPGKINPSGKYTIQNLSLRPQGTEAAEPTEADKRLAKLASLPVLLANKVLENFTPDEIRALVGATPLTPEQTAALAAAQLLNAPQPQQ